MTKCDFCIKSLPSGKCFWNSSAREDDCKRAIDCMVSALKSDNNKSSSMEAENEKTKSKK